MAPTLRVVVYGRVSTLKKEQGNSIDRQIEEGRAWAEANKGIVVKEIRETMSGAKTEKQRPGLAEAMGWLRSRKGNCLWVSRLDRLGRNVREVLRVCDEIDSLGASLLIDQFKGGQCDTRTSHGRYMFVSFANLDEFMRDLYAGAAARGKERARLEGKTVHRPREELPEVQAAEVGAILAYLAVRKLPVSWAKVSGGLAAKGMLMPARYVKAAGAIREARPWPRDTLERAWGRRLKAAQKPCEKEGEEVAENGPDSGSDEDAQK